LRTLQFLRAPTLLHDYHILENAIGDHLPDPPTPFARSLSARWRDWLYRLALERGYFDAILAELFVRPFVRVFQWCDALERRWIDFLTGDPSRSSEQVERSTSSLDDLM